ncbi:MAG TPA: trehalose-6-phosphate synthase, partial [Actinomycetota bacterium]|nr:trehalose-6-phosphate synthase [Actinomycetota bacterium]
LRPLPEAIATQFIEGMLGADLLGFHVRPWGEAFIDSAEALGYEVNRDEGWVRTTDRRIWVRSYPIPVDAQSLRTRAAADRPREWARRFRTELGTETVMVARADRIEPSKNIVRGFLAFERLLAEQPDFRDRCRFVACLYPSREALPEYKSYAEAIKTCVSDINGRYPGAISLYMEDDFDRTLGALLEYDVLLVNPIMDGMNLVAKEGPAINQRNGSLVLSQQAGSFGELRDAVVPIHDPLDIDETASALAAAVDLPKEERDRRGQALRELVEARSPEDWITPQMEDLRSIASGSAPLTPF